MAKHTVRLFNHDENVESTIVVGDDQEILDVAEDAGVDLPSMCRSGTCGQCACKLVKGGVDQSEQQFLTDEQVDQGYVLICVAKPITDCALETHKAEELL